MAYGAANYARRASDAGTSTWLIATKSQLALALQDLSFVQGFLAVNSLYMAESEK